MIGVVATSSPSQNTNIRAGRHAHRQPATAVPGRHRVVHVADRHEAVAASAHLQVLVGVRPYLGQPPQGGPLHRQAATAPPMRRTWRGSATWMALVGVGLLVVDAGDGASGRNNVCSNWFIRPM